MATSEPDADENRVTPPAVLETSVYCEDLDAARSFYRDVVGLTLVSEDPDRHLFFRVGDSSSMFLVFRPQQTRQTTVQVNGQAIPRHGPDGASHMAFQTDEQQLTHWRVQLVRHGIEIESEITWPNGGHSIYCRDPAGNSIEFATRRLWFDQ